jgi:hypothetical protein
MVIAAVDPDPKNAEKLKAWGRAYWKAVHPFNQGGAYVNFMFDDEVEGRLEATYGENYARLAAIKGQVRSEEPVQSEPEHQTGGGSRVAVGCASAGRTGRSETAGLRKQSITDSHED